MFFVLCAILVIVFLAYKFLSPEYDYFEKKGIPFSKPRFLVGSRTDMILRNKSLIDVMRDFYDEFRNDKYEMKPFSFVHEVLLLFAMFVFKMTLKLSSKNSKCGMC